MSDALIIIGLIALVIVFDVRDGNNLYRKVRRIEELEKRK